MRNLFAVFHAMADKALAAERWLVTPGDKGRTIEKGNRYRLAVAWTQNGSSKALREAVERLTEVDGSEPSAIRTLIVMPDLKKNAPAETDGPPRVVRFRAFERILTGARPAHAHSGACILRAFAKDGQRELIGLMNRVACAAVVSLALVAAGASAAEADGGHTIEGAPAVVFGQQQFGNTATGGHANNTLSSWWSLAVTSGDRITIDWESVASDTELQVFTIGTNDFNLGDASSFERSTLGSNGRDELVFLAPRTGAMPLRFYVESHIFNEDANPGPYDFTAFVRHGVRLSFPRHSRLPRRATLSVGVRNPDGVAITDAALKVTVEMKRGASKWRAVGSSSPANGMASVPVTLPLSARGKMVSLRARSQGASYVTATSRSFTAKISR